MAVGAFYKLVHKQTLGNQDCSNVWWMYQTAGTGSADDLEAAFVANWLQLLRAIQSSALANTFVGVYNHNNPGDFQETNLVANVGLASGSYLPTHDAWSMRQNRKLVGMRPGYKRFAGVPAPAVSQGVIVGANDVAAIDAFIDDVNLGLSDGGGNGWVSVIVKHVNVAAPGDKPNYKPPATITSTDYYIANEYATDYQVTTQNSRKYYT